MKKYDPEVIEKKWQDFWLQHKTFKAKDFSPKPKFYCLDMFPYPSGAGLHVGHPLGYTDTDIICRKKRHEGFEVLHPMGWDAFGLPAENYALKTGTHPSLITQQSIATFRKQIQSLGFSYDWDREIDTTDPKYFRWTQWFFLQLYKKGLAYEQEMPMAWCPLCKTVVANEEVDQGKHERCGQTVSRKNLKQWILKITNYAERLLEDLQQLPDWPEKIKTMQANWIGKSEGAKISFEIYGQEEKIPVFTTRPDTLFGVSYLVLAPEHPLVEKIQTETQKISIDEYQTECRAKSDLERTELSKEKTGVFTGAYALHPVHGKRLPIWIADYVLPRYGTGAIMAVPAHDERDFEFAKMFDLEILPVVQSVNGANDSSLPFCGEGLAIHSDFLEGLPTLQAKEIICQWLEKEKKGFKKIQYRLRDWIFTRQRYWGEPIPIVHDAQGKAFPLDERELPLLLPQVEKYEPSETGESPIASMTDWMWVRGWKTEEGTVCVLKSDEQPPADAIVENFQRETSTMPNWAGSSWYWLRYMDAHNEQEFCSKKKEQYWGPVDLYVGGTEHAVLHLLYARFWHKVLFDLGLVHSSEPFLKLVNQGLIMGEDGEKMSKSRGNVVNPDDILRSFGADTFRLYEMFMGPFEQVKLWNTNAMGGVRKFLERAWRIFEKPIQETEETNASLQKTLHKTIQVLTENIDQFRFNTAISQLMILTNELTMAEKISRKTLETYAILLSPFVPHFAEEVWSETLGHTESIAFAVWPTYNPEFLTEDLVTYAVQINGKVRAEFEISKDANQATVFQQAKSLEKIQMYLSQGTIQKEIFVLHKIVGFVVLP